MQHDEHARSMKTLTAKYNRIEKGVLTLEQEIMQTRTRLDKIEG